LHIAGACFSGAYKALVNAAVLGMPMDRGGYVLDNDANNFYA